MGITASALATLRPLFRRFLACPRLFGSASRDGTSHESSQFNFKSSSINHLRGGWRARRADTGPEELGLGNNNIGGGLGVSAVIRSANDGRGD